LEIISVSATGEVTSLANVDRPLSDKADGIPYRGYNPNSSASNSWALLPMDFLSTQHFYAVRFLSNQTLSIVRFRLTDWSLDTTFGNQGHMRLDIADKAWPNQKIVNFFFNEHTSSLYFLGDKLYRLQL